MKFSIVTLILLFPFSFLNSQEESYLDYHKEFAIVEGLIVNEQFKNAEDSIEAIFSKFDVLHAADYVVAAQVCLLNGNKNKAIEYIELSMSLGVKLECLLLIPIFKNQLLSDELDKIRSVEEEIMKKYLQSIDLELSKKFHSRYQYEQDVKGSAGEYKKAVQVNFEAITNSLSKGEFPGERKLGLDNKDLANSLSDCEFGNSKVITTLLHYDYPLTEIGEDVLVMQIQFGNLHPREFATIYTFEKNRISLLYQDSIKEIERAYHLNFNFPFEKRDAAIEKVNSDRRKFGICDFEVDEMKAEISKKHGIRLTFNY